MSSHKRSVGEQVKSGFVIDGELLGGLIICGVTAKSLGILIADAPTRHFRGPLIAWLAIIVATTIIFGTAERWGGFVPGFLFFYAAAKGFAYSLIPPIAPHDPAPLTRSAYLGIGFYSVLAIVFLWRFIPPRKTRATILDRIALTVFALTVLIAIVLQEPTSLMLDVSLIGLLALLGSWIIDFRLKKQHRNHRHACPTASGVSPSPE